MKEHIILMGSQKNIADYEEYKRTCATAGITPYMLGAWHQIAGRLICAMFRYDAILPLDAFNNFVEDLNTAMGIPPGERKPCDNCGGGTVV